MPLFFGEMISPPTRLPDVKLQRPTKVGGLLILSTTTTTTLHKIVCARMMGVGKIGRMVFFVISCYDDVPVSTW